MGSDHYTESTMAGFMNDLISSCLSYDICLRPKQVEVFTSIELFFRGHHQEDILVNLPVGYGKSLLYQVIPGLIRRINFLSSGDEVVLVVSPLNVIQDDQLRSMTERNITCCKIEMEGNISRVVKVREGEWQSVPCHKEDVLQGCFSVVVCHPEALLNTVVGGELLQNEHFSRRVKAVVIDECHIVEEWGKNFRSAFKRLHTLAPCFSQSLFLALSGTLTKEQKKSLPGLLGLRSSFKIVETNPDKNNIFLDVKKKMSVKERGDTYGIYEAVFMPVLEELKLSPSDFPVTFMFLPLKYMSEAARKLSTMLTHIDIYDSVYSCVYSTQDKEVISETISELKKDNSRIRLVLCTSCVGMGFDPCGVTRIIHASPPRSISKYMQEIGRGGRRGQPCTATLYFDNNDIRSNIENINKDIIEYCRYNGCYREKILYTFGFCKNDDSPKGCTCCSYCSKLCECSKCDMEMIDMMNAL